MGKNFSLNNVTGKRKKSDSYETPFSMTRQFLTAFDDFVLERPVLEPACGNGAISCILKECGFKNVIEKDLFKTGDDFFEEKEEFSYIITNPPYSKAHAWILKCKEICTAKFALLLPLSYLHGQKRYREIWQDREFPLQSIYVFTRYPMLGDPLRPDGKYRTGMQVYAWYLWSKHYRGEAPLIKWIDNNMYVLNKRDKP